MKALLLALTFIFSIQAASADTIIGKVVGVSDGDTITVLDQNNTQYKVRLAGIDAPEKKQAFGNVSKKSLSDLVFDSQVTVDWHKQDRYGRIVGKVILNGQDVNLEQINRGMAWFYKKYQNELILDDRLSYLRAQVAAKNSNTGLWLDHEPIAPWVFRKK
jgi:endonuclease YncB( thermonuclease family)